MRSPGSHDHDPPLWAWIFAGLVSGLALVMIVLQAVRLGL